MFEEALENKKLAPASQDLMGHGDWSLLVRNLAHGDEAWDEERRDNGLGKSGTINGDHTAHRCSLSQKDSE